MNRMRCAGDGGDLVRNSASSGWKIGFWLGGASLTALVLGALMHMRSLMACAPIILIGYFGYLFYCLMIKSDVPKQKTEREESFDENSG